ncbi:MAG: SDR family NAD(P)-dependent oxidoreductase [Spirochaetota bacterium]
MGVLSLFELKDEVSIVTGAARGLGKEVAIGMAEAGADVVIMDLLGENAKDTAKEIEKIGRKAIVVEGDVTNEDDVKRLVRTTLDELGKIDILVNNAGIVSWVPAEEMEFKEWYRIINTNLNGVFNCCKYVGREMIKRRKGSIINVSSMSSLIVNNPQKQCHYNTSKAGIDQLTKCLAFEWAPYNVRVNAVLPGYMKTELLKEADEEYLKFWSSIPAQKRIADPAELKGIFVFLASKAASYFCGSLIVCDGGYTLW